MREWDFWDWTAYSLLGIAIVIDVIEQTDKRSATLSQFLPDMDLGFLALAAFLLATGVFVVKQFGWIGASRAPQEADRLSRPKELRPITEFVHGKKFFNELVEIDGRQFRDCEFTNVTFCFNGLGVWSFVNCPVHGSIMVKCDDPAVASYALLADIVTRNMGHGGFLGLTDKEGNIKFENPQPPSNSS